MSLASPQRAITARMADNPLQTRAAKRLCIWCAAPTTEKPITGPTGHLQYRLCTQCRAVYAIAKEREE